MVTRFIAHAPGKQDPDVYRQFVQIQQRLTAIENKISTPVNVETIPAPVLVTELNSPVTVVTLFAQRLPPGWYQATVNFRSRYDQSNDQLIWNIGGDVNLGPFIVQSVVAGEEIPFAYLSTFRIDDGEITLSLICSTSGPGAADVEITQAVLSLIRVMGDEG
jgi:hypothetical protein